MLWLCRLLCRNYVVHLLSYRSNNLPGFIKPFGLFSMPSYIQFLQVNVNIPLFRHTYAMLGRNWTIVFLSNTYLFTTWHFAKNSSLFQVLKYLSASYRHRYDRTFKIRIVLLNNCINLTNKSWVINTEISFLYGINGAIKYLHVNAISFLLGQGSGSIKHPTLFHTMLENFHCFIGSYGASNSSNT